MNVSGVAHTSEVPRRYANPIEVDLVRWLASAGLNASELARATGVSRASIRDWLSRPDEWPRRRTIRGQGLSPCCPRCHGRPLDPRPYVYLLGLYLGDGYIATHPRGVYRLRICCANSYPDLIRQCAEAMGSVRGGGTGPGHAHQVGCVEVYAYWKHWRCLFPQHGPGRKHEREIRLVPWQWRAVLSCPDQLLKGLLHSDGCRVLNRVNGTDYPRYFFTNHSHDIRAIFSTTCDLMDIQWRRSRWNTISVARRRDVALLDRFVGPKR
jgi:hypothetical protein